MASNLTEKILADHLVSGTLEPGNELGIQIDQTLTQDSTGTIAYLQFEAMGIPRVRTKLSASYIDHNMLQEGFENADDHRYLQSVAAKYGIYFSRPGNGICHQVHLERFGVPGETLLGSDSHTPTVGGLGMLGIGVGGLDVAVALGGGPYYFVMPKVVEARLTGKLSPWVSSKDVIMALAGRLTVTGGVGKIFEYTGPGLEGLTVPQRATMTNMGAELGATTSICPSDEQTRRYLELQKRPQVWKRLAPDSKADFDEHESIDLSKLEPMVALPHSPDNVKPVSEVAGLKVQQVAIGSCTNSSYHDLMVAAEILRGKTIHPDVSLVVTPGSRQVLETIARNGALAELIRSGARILESACGPCIGMGQAPASGSVSLRTYNRNFEGRAGTRDARVYLVSPEVAAVSALTGKLTDPRDFGEAIRIDESSGYAIDDGLILPPAPDPSKVEILRGPNIKPVPSSRPLSDTLEGEVLLKVGDNITTDHILPAGAKVLPLRSNIPAIAEYTFERIDPTFPERARRAGGGAIVGGENYGQGSSREHAAIAPMFLGVGVVLAKSFARIHRTNLINFGILPLTFSDPHYYDQVAQGDRLRIVKVRDAVGKGASVAVENLTRQRIIQAEHTLTARERDILLAGGLLSYTHAQAS